MAWSPDGRRLATSHNDDIVRVWDVDRDALPQHLLGHQWRVGAVSWSPDGRRLATGGADATVRVWDAGDGRPVRVLTGHSGTVSGLAWSPDGRRLASSGHDQTVRVWELDGTGNPRILEGHGDRVTAVAWSPDGGLLSSSGEDGTVRVWDPDSSPDPLELRNPSGSIGALSWSPDGRRLATSSWDQFVRIWDAEGGDPILSLACGPRGGHCVAWSPDGSRLAANRDDGHVAVWDSADGKPVLDFRWNGKEVVSLAWSPDGRRLAAAGWDEEIRIWATDGATDPVVLRGHRSRIHAVAWSPDGSRLASAGDDGRVVIWHPETGRSVRSLVGPTLASRALAWSPDGRRIATGGEDTTIRIWDPETGVGLAVLRGHTGHVRSISWSVDGSRLASGGDDRVVHLWDATARRGILALRGHTGSINGVAWDPNGRRLASAGEDRVVMIRDANPGYLADRSDRLLTFPETAAWHRLRAEVLAHRGDWGAAAAEFRLAMAGAEQGADPAFLGGWWAAGPFDHPGSEPMPGGELDLESRASPWVPVEATADGRVGLGRHLPPGHAGSAYAWLRVWSAGTAPVRLRIGASGRFRAWIDGRPIPGATPTVGALGTIGATVTMSAGWNSLVFRVADGGDRPGLRVWIDSEADVARDRIDLLLGRGRWSEAGAEIEQQARSRPGTAPGHHDRGVRAARSRASWLQGQGRFAEAGAAGRMAAYWSDRLKSFPDAPKQHVPGQRRGRRHSALGGFRIITGDTDGTVYAVATSGNLLWYKDLARDGTTNLALSNGVVIGTGWDAFTHVISGGGGVIYAIDTSGNLRWYKDSRRDGTPATASAVPSFDGPNNGVRIGSGWGGFLQVFSGGNGILYAIDREGNLRWFQDTHRDGTPVTADNAPSFESPSNGAIIGTGWDRFTSTFSTGNGVIFGRDTAGNLTWYKDLARNGTIEWAPGSGTSVASGFDAASVPVLVSGGSNADGDGVIYVIGSNAERRVYRVQEEAGSTPSVKKIDDRSPIGPGGPAPRGPAEESHSRRELPSVPGPPGVAETPSADGMSGPVGDEKRSH